MLLNDDHYYKPKIRYNTIVENVIRINQLVKFIPVLYV